MNDPYSPTMTPLEVQPTFTLLGIRFWDPATNSPVTHDLRVTAWPDGRPQRKVTAFRTGAGVYAFPGLPGLRHLERPTGDATPWDEDVMPARFIFEVADRRGRYLTLTYSVNVPFRGIFPSDALTSPSTSTPGTWLFSAPTRTGTPALALLRAQLLVADPSLPGLPDPPQPAAYAVVELEINGDRWHGITAADGQVALFFPYPDFTSPLGFTSPVVAMPEQSWSFTVRVRYQESAQSVPDGATGPSVSSLFDQAQADIWLNETGDTAGDVSRTFAFGEEPVLHTGAAPTLWLTPGS